MDNKNHYCKLLLKLKYYNIKIKLNIILQMKNYIVLKV